MENRRPAIPKKVQTELLHLSRRRCCLCFGLNRDIEQKEGQIAHLDRNPRNNTLENLVWLCLHHHDEYDTIRRQTKRLTAGEIETYRRELYRKLAELAATGTENEKTENDPALQVMHRYSFADDDATKVITAEILMRIEQIYQYFRIHEREWKAMEKLQGPSLTEEQEDGMYERITQEVKEKLKLPAGVWGLNPEGTIPTSWRTSAQRLARRWARGCLSYDECVDVLWMFDELYDFDLHYILFGLPNRTLAGIQYRALESFIFQHGQRNLIG
jgi:hypothetical protein